MKTSFPSRIERARDIADAGQIRIEGESFKVPSSSGDRVYTVRLVDGRPVCNCEDFRRRQQACKHCLAAALHVKESEAAQ